jgi:hypothetical protein
VEVNLEMEKSGAGLVGVVIIFVDWPIGLGVF